jgi:hypothetical protein
MSFDLANCALRAGFYWCVKASDAEEFSRLADRGLAADLHRSRMLVVEVATTANSEPIIYVPGSGEQHKASQFVDFRPVQRPL